MDYVRVLQVALGIGLVIFVHEFGHFIAARLCKVRVDVFSLGFGPRLLGWRRGATTYQLALIPLGGYVKMAGEEGDPSAPSSDDLRSKSVGQRFFIFSGGVLMNVLFGLIVFPIVLALGVPFSTPVIGEALPGGPAWHARIEPNTRVLAVNDAEVISFMHLQNEVALGERSQVRLLVQEPGAAAAREVTLAPRFVDDPGILSIDVLAASDPLRTIQVAEGTSAHAAGLRTGDRIVGVVDGLEGMTFEEELARAADRAEPLRLEIERDGERRTIDVTAGEAKDPGPVLFGFSPPLNWVRDVRDNADIQALGLQKDDRLIAVQGQTIRRIGDFAQALLSSDQPLAFTVERDGRRVELAGPALDAKRRIALHEDVALARDEAATRIVLARGSPAAGAGLQDGDRILRADQVAVHSWKELYEITKNAAQEQREITFSVERGEPRELLEVDVQPQAWRQTTYGFAINEDTYVYRAPNAVAAIKVGVESSWRSLVDAWRTLTRIAVGDVSSENIGGIITISAVSYSFSSEGLAKLFFFLCMLSLNLAFLNILPVPVLDGGHLLFLLIEGIKGSPVSERVQGYSQMVGLVLLVSLMIYVTYNDILRVLQ